jgi:triacylglycerol esterase/lipase EstA (alpha/beta hydrolase family)
VLASYARLSLLCEAAAYAAIAHWVHWLYGWGYPALTAAALCVAYLNRLLMVCITTAAARLAAGPRDASQRVPWTGEAAMVLREAWAVAAAQLFQFPFHRWAVRPDPPAAPTQGIPVILVHGYYSDRGYFGHLVRSLEACGAAPVFTPNFTSIFASIERFAAELHDEIERICAGTGAPQVVLVCHSMGGLAARSYLARHGPARVRRLVTIASPHAGTVHARLGGGTNARQMRRGSAFLAALREREGERGPGCATTSLYTPQDNLVVPAASSVLPWARNVAIPGLGHVEILRSPRLALEVRAELRESGVALR